MLKRSLQLSKSILQPLLILAGLAGIVWLCGRIGWPAIRTNIGLIGKGFFLLVVLYLFAQMAFMAGWWVLIGSRARQIGYWRMFGVYLVGDSINYFVPPANLTGEPVKAHLLSRSVGFSRSVTSIMVHKHAEIVAQVVFLSLGLSIAVAQFALPAGIRAAALGLAGGMGAVVIIAFWALKRRAFGTLLRGLMKIGIKPEHIDPQWHATASLDRWLALFYKTRMSVFYWATFWCLLGWCGGLLETYLVLQWLSTNPSLGTAIAVESLAMALNSIIFFIPGRVGSAETVRVAVFSVLGLPAAQGAVYSIIRRGREVTWAIPGLLILLAMKTGIVGAPGEVTG
ncbi:lysylphosphatidylglycerol synthase transmembrane domain-containing protein [Candidatus Methylomirabilis sp.]|uniref:lysylphosphatidylglycerol synthase transmembrane domain-containing protein n=1 Tax=Candidatus Methylomirabilis sp. TaxID=2032687 RepID=UPI002A688AAF|nr:lysylphosphatidylglycerol synthase transmembrane domain-containing protein [Candidatus Methylomirabilis sp.]